MEGQGRREPLLTITCCLLPLSLFPFYARLISLILKCSSRQLISRSFSFYAALESRVRVRFPEKLRGKLSDWRDNQIRQQITCWTRPYLHEKERRSVFQVYAPDSLTPYPAAEGDSHALLHIHFRVPCPTSHTLSQL